MIIYKEFPCEHCGKIITDSSTRRRTRFCNKACAAQHQDREKPDRNKLILNDLKRGDTLSAIGKRYGISHERVRQVGIRFGWVPPGRGFNHPPAELYPCLRCGIKTRNKKYCGHTCAGMAKRHMPDDGTNRVCTQCEESKPYEEYYKVSGTQRLMGHCKKCQNKKVWARLQERLNAGDEKLKHTRREATKRYYWKTRVRQRAPRKRGARKSNFFTFRVSNDERQLIEATANHLGCSMSDLVRMVIREADDLLPVTDYP